MTLGKNGSRDVCSVENKSFWPENKQHCLPDLSFSVRRRISVKHQLLSYQNHYDFSLVSRGLSWSPVVCLGSPWSSVVPWDLSFSCRKRIPVKNQLLSYKNHYDFFVVFRGLSWTPVMCLDPPWSSVVSFNLLWTSV